MAVVNSFSRETLTNFLTNNLQLENKQNLKYLVKESSLNKDILCLSVAAENEDFIVEHLMVKMVSKEDINKKKLEYSHVLERVFTLQDDNNDVYLGFENRDVLYPSKNNFENLTIILKSLAQYQVNNLFKREERIINTDYDVKNVADAVVSLELFKALDEVNTNDIISRLQQEVDKLLNNGLLVKSIGSVSANNVFITASGKCVFLDLGSEVFRSPVYDVLIFIFALSDENFRQNHLKTLLNQYYETFVEFLKKVDNTTVPSFDVNVFEKHLKTFLPLVKFETAAYLSQKENSVQEKPYLKELLNNISYSLKYHQVSYEDCLEAISKRVGSTEFQLINYQLIPLDERNGHLGQYFTLKSNVKFSGKNEVLSMFIKILYSEIPRLTALVECGASKKEQHFFRTLIPLFKQNGLESLIAFAPNCYFDRLNDVLILDDLNELNFKPSKPSSKVGYDFLKTAFLKLAKLHACTLICEERMSQRKGIDVRLGDIYEEYMEDWVFAGREGDPDFVLNIASAKPGLDQLIDSFEDIPKQISNEEFHKRVDALFDVFLERMTYPAKQFRNVIGHGDMYASNLLVKYDQNNVAEDCFLIDYQALRYVPISQDLLMLTYTSTNKDVRDKYLGKLLEEYYQELKKILSEFHLDINDFYTPEQFTECIKYMKPMAILTATIYGQVMSIPLATLVKHFGPDELLNYFYKNRKEFVRTLLTMSEDGSSYFKGLIEDLYDICLNGPTKH